MGALFEALGINGPALLAQVISFFILFGLLMAVAYKPIIKMFDERTRRIRDSMVQAEEIKQQSLQAEEQVKKRLEEASKEGQVLIARATRTAEETRLALQEQAKKDAEALLNRAKAEIQQERDEAVSSVRREFADLTIMAASKVIDKSLDKDAHRELIDKVLKESQPPKKG